MDYLSDNIEEKLKQFILDFEKDFEIEKKKNGDKKLLELLYREYVEANAKPSKEYYFIINKISNVQSILSKILTDEQKEVMQEYIFLYEKLQEESTLQVFLQGWRLGIEIKEQTKKI